MTGASLIPRPLPVVLVADHDADTRDLYRFVFMQEGWEVLDASDGRVALVRALADGPSMLLTELRLPIIDGVSLCERLREDPATTHIPILVVTGETRANEWERASRAGADAVLLKPTRPDKVLAEMRRLNDLRAARLEKKAASKGRRMVLVKAHLRYETTTPDEPPATLFCPICLRSLVYRRTFIGGVSRRHSERWDYYHCSSCGQFQYRYRTRKLRRMP